MTDEDPLMRAAAALEAQPGPSVLVLDDTELRGDLEFVHALTRALPAGSQLALASRGEPALPIGSLRAQGQIIEIGPADLAMTRRESAAMLSMAGVDLEPADLAALLRHTEGWPAPSTSLRSRSAAATTRIGRSPASPATTGSSPTISAMRS